MNIEIKEVPFGSEEYQALFALRYEILRKPLGLEVSDKDIAQDREEFHIGAWREGRPVGCVLLRPLEGGKIKLRQMAVAEESRGCGIGARLVTFAEKLAVSRGFTLMEMHARRVAEKFYEKLGYAVEGEEYIEVTIPHVTMWKKLSV